MSSTKKYTEEKLHNPQKPPLNLHIFLKPRMFIGMAESWVEYKMGVIGWLVLALRGAGESGFAG